MSSGHQEAAPATGVRLTADAALLTRRSVRAFLPQPVARAEVEELLALASRSASGSNIQPWKVHVFRGELRQRISLIRPLLGIPDNQIIICGLALGFADPDALVNRLATERAPVGEFASFTGFEA